MDKDFFKQANLFSEKFKTENKLDHLVKKVVGPQVLKKICPEDKKKFLLELGKIKSVPDNKGSFYNQITKSIHIKKDQTGKNLTGSIGEEIAHAYTSWKKGKAPESDVEEFYGYLGKVAATKEVDTNLEKIYDKVVDSHIALGFCCNKEILEGVYKKIKKNYGCKECKESKCNECNIHKETIGTLRNGLTTMLTNTEALNKVIGSNNYGSKEDIIKRNIGYKHLGGYTLASKLIKERLEKGEKLNHILRDLVKLDRKEVDKKLKEYGYLTHLHFTYADKERRIEILGKLLKELNKKGSLKNNNSENFEIEEPTLLDLGTNTVIKPQKEENDEIIKEITKLIEKTNEKNKEKIY